MHALFYALLTLTVAFQEPSEALNPNLASKPTEAPAEVTAPQQGEEDENSKPKYKRPRRGPAPSPADFTDVEYEMNSDGTIRRRVVRFGGVINEGRSDSELNKPAFDPDPNYTSPVHSSVSSINLPSEKSNDCTPLTSETPLSLDPSLVAPLVCAAILGGLFVTGFLFGLLTKPAAASKPFEGGPKEVSN